jgi:hypothetical protein
VSEEYFVICGTEELLSNSYLEKFKTKRLYGVGRERKRSLRWSGLQPHSKREWCLFLWFYRVSP